MQKKAASGRLFLLCEWLLENKADVADTHLIGDCGLVEVELHCHVAVEQTRLTGGGEVAGSQLHGGGAVARACLQGQLFVEEAGLQYICVVAEA